MTSAERRNEVGVCARCATKCSNGKTVFREEQKTGREQIGWYQLRDVSDFIEVDIWARRVFVHPVALNHLAGKQLILGTHGKRELLVAVPGPG